MGGNDIEQPPTRPRAMIAVMGKKVFSGLAIRSSMIFYQSSHQLSEEKAKGMLPPPYPHTHKAQNTVSLTKRYALSLTSAPHSHAARHSSYTQEHMSMYVSYNVYHTSYNICHVSYATYQVAYNHMII